MAGGPPSVSRARFELTRVPGDLRRRDRQIGRGAPLLKSYERITFERELVRQEGKPIAELVAPGHPLLDAVIDLVSERYGTLLQQGAVLVDDQDEGEALRILVYLEHSIRDGVRVTDGDYRVVSRRFEFVEVDTDGNIHLQTWAPYLDLRPLEEGEWDMIAPSLDGEWIREEIAERAEEYAIGEAVPKHLAEVRRRVEDRVERVKVAVKTQAGDRDSLLGSPRQRAQGAGACRQEATAQLRPGEGYGGRAAGPTPCTNRGARSRAAARAASAAHGRRRTGGAARATRAAARRADERGSRARGRHRASRPGGYRCGSGCREAVSGAIQPRCPTTTRATTSNRRAVTTYCSSRSRGESREARP